MRKKSIQYFLAVLFSTVIMIPAAVGQVQIYVNGATGNDTTGTGTAGQPYKTVTRGMQALNAAAAGSDLLIAPGVYTTEATHVVQISGTPANPVQIGGNGGRAELWNQWFIVDNGVSNVWIHDATVHAAVHPACIVFGTVTDCTATNIGVDNAQSGGDYDIQAKNAGLLQGNNVEKGPLSLKGAQRIYVSNMVLDITPATRLRGIMIADIAVQGASVIIEDSTLDISSTASVIVTSFGKINGFVLRRCFIRSNGYPIDMNIDNVQGFRSVNFGTNRWILENCTIINKNAGNNVRVFGMATDDSGSNDFVFRNTTFISASNLCFNLTQRHGTATGTRVKNWRFENCAFRNVSGTAPLSTAVGGGELLYFLSHDSWEGFTFSGCKFQGQIPFYFQNDTISATDFTVQNCEFLSSSQFFEQRAPGPMVNLQVRDCSITCQRGARFGGQLVNSLIQDTTYYVPNSAGGLAGEGCISLSSAAGGGTTNGLTVRRCRLISQNPIVPAFSFDGKGSSGVTLEDCYLQAASLGIDTGTSRDHANFMMSGCSVVCTFPGTIANFAFRAAQNQTIENCAFDGSGLANGIVLGSPLVAPQNTGLSLSGCSVNHVAGTGILIAASAAGATVQGCTVANVTGSGNGIELVADSLTADTTNVRIQNNWLSDVVGFGIAIEGSSHTVRGNTVVRATQGGIRIRENPGLVGLFVSRPNKNIVVERNGLYGNSTPLGGSVGIKLDNPSAASVNLRIVNNTVLLWQSGLAMLGGNVRDARVFNNIFSSNTGTALTVAGSGHTIGFNGYFGNGANGSGVAVPGNGDVLADPSFLSTTPGNPSFLKLSPTSPMVDAGSLDGVNKHLNAPGGDEIDLGCIESAASEISGWRAF